MTNSFSEEEAWELLSSPTKPPRDLQSKGPEELALQMYREAVVGATQSIINVAVNGMNERTRLSAAIYVTERVLGRTPDAPSTAKGGWEDLLAKTVVEAEKFANEQGAG
jgi:hypothetical protein